MDAFWFLGVDWGCRSHAFCLMDADGARVLQRRARDDASEVEGVVRELLASTDVEPTQVRVAIEVPRGALIDFFLTRGFEVYAINPKQSDRCRERYTPAGAKDDARDAWVLADALRTTPRAFRRIQPDAAWVVELRELTRLWDDLEGDHRRFANRLAEQIHRLNPALWALCPGADASWLWTLLETAPTAQARQQLTPAAVEHLLRTHRVRRITPAVVLQALHTQVFPLAPGVIAAAERHIAALVPQLRTVAAARRACRADVDRLLDEATRTEEQCEHRDVAILRSLPGLGTWTAATMLGEAAQPLDARDYHRVRTIAGVAPVTKQSGKRRVVSMRRGCHRRLRQAMYHWSLASLSRDAAAHAYYQRLRARGVAHASALRCVADRWLRILIAMLRTQTPYQPSVQDVMA